MLVAFQMYGLQPGPSLLEHNRELVWGLIASLYIANVLLVIINLPLVGVWVQLLKDPEGAPDRCHAGLRDRGRVQHPGQSRRCR